MTTETEVLEKSIETTSISEVYKLTPKEIFEGGQLMIMVDAVVKEVKSIVITPENSKNWMQETKSLAYKVAQTKSFIDKARKIYLDDQQKFIKSVNSVSGQAVDILQKLQDEVKKPVTDYEAREEKRIADIKAKIIALDPYKSYNGLTPSNKIREAIKVTESLDLDSLEEFMHLGKKTKDDVLEILSGALMASEEFEEKEAQRVKLEQEDKERKEAARIAQIQEDARLKAEADAAKKIEDEKKKIEADAQKKIDDEKKRLQDEAAAEAKKIKDEQDRKDAKERADKIEQKRLDDEKAKADSDKEHVRAVNINIRSLLMDEGVSQEQAESIIRLIVYGKIPHVKINYGVK